MSWQTNFKDTAHYVPLTGEIRASKIQGEGRGYPDSVPGDPDYVGNPTGIAKPEEMRFDDRRYRRMCFPDGRIPFNDFLTNPFGNNGNAKGATVIGGFGYPEYASSRTRVGGFFNPSYINNYINPFRGTGYLFSSYTSYPPNGQMLSTYYASQLVWSSTVPAGATKPVVPKPHRTQIQYRALRQTDLANNVDTRRNQIKYARGLNRTDIDWRPQTSQSFTNYGYGYGPNQIGSTTSTNTNQYGSLGGLEQPNSGGEGPFNVPITDAGEIKFSDFRGKNKFYKTRSMIGKNEALGLGAGAYPSSNTTLNQTILGNYVGTTTWGAQGIYEFVGLYGTMQNSTASDDAYNPDGSRGYAHGYVNPDFGGKLSASGITLPSSRGAMQHVSTLTTAAFTNNAANSSSRFKPLFASGSFAEPKNSATIGRYDSVTKSMPSYDYVNQGTGSTNRVPIVTNPRSGEMTHCIWYKPNQTGTGAWNGDYSLGSTGGTNGPNNDGYGLETTWNTAAYASNETGGRLGVHVLEFGVLGRHYHSGLVVQEIYWDTGYRYGNMGNTGNSADEERGGGQFIDGTNVWAQLSSFNGEIFYASPSADNLYFGATVWRCAYRVYNPNENKTPPSGWNSSGNVPFDWPAYLTGSNHVTRIIFTSTASVTYGGSAGTLNHGATRDGVDA
tara:strand:- start:71 stop:2074 length:2004 start_codon:yes stop_codon:yes gene_type:complete